MLEAVTLYATLMIASNNLVRIVVFLLFACNSRTQPHQNTDTSKSVLKGKWDQISDTANKSYPYTIIQIYLNDDTVKDYFVINHTGITTGQFFDGESGREIPTDGVNSPWSRPGVDLNYKIVNLLCQDRQSEVLVQGGSGGTAGLTLTTEIYRFDSDLGIIKLVFQHDELVSHRDDNGNDVVDEINYIGLTYGKDSCDIKVFVCKGTYKNNTVAALKNAKRTFYCFDEIKKQFEELKQRPTTSILFPGWLTNEQ